MYLQGSIRWRWSRNEKSHQDGGNLSFIALDALKLTFAKLELAFVYFEVTSVGNKGHTCKILFILLVLGNSRGFGACII